MDRRLVVITLLVGIATAPVTRSDIVERVDATGGGTATPGATISGDPR